MGNDLLSIFANGTAQGGGTFIATKSGGTKAVGLQREGNEKDRFCNIACILLSGAAFL